jgi:hypothetical protein
MALEYAIVGINEGIISTEIAPFGGMKESGMGLRALEIRHRGIPRSQIPQPARINADRSPSRRRVGARKPLPLPSIVPRDIIASNHANGGMP